MLYDLLEGMMRDPSNGNKAVFVLCEWTAGGLILEAVERFTAGGHVATATLVAVAVGFAILGTWWPRIKPRLGSKFSALFEGIAADYRSKTFLVVAATVTLACLLLMYLRSARNGGQAQPAPWLVQVVDSDDQNIERRIQPELADMHILPHLDAPEPYVELRIGIINTSIFTLRVDHFEGSVWYRGYPLQSTPSIIKAPPMNHGELGEIFLRQPVSSDAAKIMRTQLAEKGQTRVETCLHLGMGRFAIWFRYGEEPTNKMVRKAFPDSLFSICRCE